MKPVQGPKDALGQEPFAPARLAFDRGLELLVAIRGLLRNDALARLDAHEVVN